MIYVIYFKQFLKMKLPWEENCSSPSSDSNSFGSFSTVFISSTNDRKNCTRFLNRYRIICSLWIWWLRYGCAKSKYSFQDYFCNYQSKLQKRLYWVQMLLLTAKRQLFILSQSRLLKRIPKKWPSRKTVKFSIDMQNF